MTEIERINAAKTALTSVPGGEIWIEELLIRGQPGGTIKAAHIVYAWRASDAFGGKTPVQMMSPFPITIGAEEAAWSDVCTDINAAALATIAEKDATITSLQQQISDMQQQLSEAQ